MSGANNIVYQSGIGSLGQVLVAATASGICAVLFRTADSILLADLHKRFDHARPAKDNSLSQYVQQVIAFIEAPYLPMTIPLDMHGSDFQKQVWRTLLLIPAGETRSYSQIATQIGKPKAYRAVANACARNPIAVLIPCHRVVHKSGSTSGYFWGAKTKQVLQYREAGR